LIKLWDPLADRCLFQQPIGERLLWKDSGEQEIATLDATGMLRIVDGLSGAVRVCLDLEKADIKSASQIVFFGDSDRYYVNLQPLQQAPEERRYSYPLGTDTTLPRVDLRGDLWAIDRGTGVALWKRSLPPRTAMRSIGVPLPVLVLLSLVGDRIEGNSRSLLAEVLDASTGETLCVHDACFRDQILQMSYLPEESSLRLWGKKSTITLELLRSGAQATADAPLDRLSGDR
jgi:hypothetical protein